MVMDTGVASYTLPSLMKERKLRFVFPLRRNMKKIVDYGMRLGQSFPYRDRGVNCGKRRVKKNDGLFLYMYEDTKLRYEEEATFVSLIRDRKRKQADLEVERPKFGKISLLSSIDDDPERVYLLWKNREEVEEAFDAMKNELENDKAYLSNDDAIRGYFFTSFLSLYTYYRLLEMLRRKGLTGKVSVNELLFELSKVYLISYSDGKKRLSDIPAKAERLEKSLGIELFPKNLRS
jgi:transposase